MDLSLKIDTVERIDRQDFINNYFIPQKPVIIRNLIKDSPAREKWTLQFLKQKLGSTPVGVFDNRKKKNSAYTFPDLKMPFADFIDIIAKDEPCNYRLFLFNGFKYCPDLRSDFNCPEIMKGVLDHLGLMFFGGKSTDVRIHFDIDMSNVLHTQFIGKKRILLFSPEYSPLLYKLPFNTYSSADFGNIDYSAYPGLRYVKGYEITLEHGDSLFMPSGYWHYMKYLEGGFAVTYRKMAHSMDMKLCALLNMTTRLWLDKFMNFTQIDYWKSHKEKVAFRKAEEAMQNHVRINYLTNFASET